MRRLLVTVAAAGAVGLIGCGKKHPTDTGPDVPPMAVSKLFLVPRESPALVAIDTQTLDLYAGAVAKGDRVAAESMIERGLVFAVTEKTAVSLDGAPGPRIAYVKFETGPHAGRVWSVDRKYLDEPAPPGFPSSSPPTAK
jgi:hypothetical protein